MGHWKNKQFQQQSRERKGSFLLLGLSSSYNHTNLQPPIPWGHLPTEGKSSSQKWNSQESAPSRILLGAQQGAHKVATSVGSVCHTLHPEACGMGGRRIRFHQFLPPPPHTPHWPSPIPVVYLSWREAIENLQHLTEKVSCPS